MVLIKNIQIKLTNIAELYKIVEELKGQQQHLTEDLINDRPPNL